MRNRRAIGRTWDAGPSRLTAGSEGSHVGVGAGLPLLVHVTPSFFVGFGPGVAHGVSDDETRSLHLSANTFMADGYEARGPTKPITTPSSRSLRTHAASAGTGRRRVAGART